jgi:hypothetical protein
MPIDPLSAFVPFVPLPDTQRSAWAILCPTGCTTELIILPEHAGQWVECPTCGFRFLGPHPAQPKMVAEARARTARVAAEDAKMAGVLAALAKVDPQPKPPVAAKPDKPKAAKPQAKIPGKSPPLPESDEILFAKPVSGQVQVMDVLEMLADASREAAAPPPAARRPRIMLLKARPAPKPPAQQEAKAASALDELEKKCHRPAGRQPVVPEPPRRASAPAELASGDLTPEETLAIDALEALAEATIPARKAPAPAAAATPAAAARPVAAKKSPGRVALRLDMSAPRRRKKSPVTKRPERGAMRTAARAISPAHARGGHSDLALTWVVSLAIAAAIVATAFGCGLPDLALGAAPFVGLAVIRTWKALQRNRDDGMSY